MHNDDLALILNNFLQVSLFKDYAPNGLQVEGKKQIHRIVTGVTACQRLIDAAVDLNADAVLVHHGFFWKNEPLTITGIKYQRIKTLIKHDINLYGYHLPLDGHPIVGNNVLLGKMFGVQIDERTSPTDLLFKGNLTKPKRALELKSLVEEKLHHTVLFCGDDAPEQIKRVAWCSGGGQDFIEQAALAGCDAFITGEVSERTIHLAREYGINFYAAGHHATERYGICALGEWLAQQYDLDVTFVDIDNPA